jgi:hypothetical protein
MPVRVPCQSHIPGARKKKELKPPSKNSKRGKNLEKRKKPKPEEQEGMPQRHHCPLSKRREDRNPKYHEEQQKDVA